MNPKLLLRIASIIMLLHAVGHTSGTLNWQATTDPSVHNVVQGMVNQHFIFMGKLSSLGMYYSGFCFTTTFMLLFITVLLWVLSNHAVNEPLTKKIGIMLCVFLFVLAFVEYVYFFALAVVLSSIAGVLTTAAMVSISKKTRI
jgi:hypothetical protein